MLWLIGLLILAAIVSGSARDAMKGLMTLILGGLFLIVGCAVV